jgi:hypothetical protein
VLRQEGREVIESFSSMIPSRLQQLLNDRDSIIRQTRGAEASRALTLRTGIAVFV